VDARREEDRLDLRAHLAVGQRDLQPYSKSETARRPRRIAVQPCLRATSISSSSNRTTSTPGSSPTASRHRQAHLRRVERPLLRVARHRDDDTVEDRAPARIRSMWPFVIGSKVPGRSRSVSSAVSSRSRVVSTVSPNRARRRGATGAAGIPAPRRCWTYRRHRARMIARSPGRARRRRPSRCRTAVEERDSKRSPRRARSLQAGAGRGGAASRVECAERLEVAANDGERRRVSVDEVAWRRRG